MMISSLILVLLLPFSSVHNQDRKSNLRTFKAALNKAALRRKIRSHFDIISNLQQQGISPFPRHCFRTLGNVMWVDVRGISVLSE